MSKTTSWQVFEPNVVSASGDLAQPLEALAKGAIPAIVFRGAWPAELCHRLYDTLIAEQLLYDPTKPVPDTFVDTSIPEGYYREGSRGVERRAWQEKLSSGKRRIDIGTSLGYRGSNKEEFLAHASQTRELFDSLFDDIPSPVRLIYEKLGELAVGKTVKTAYEPDGRQYGPAIIRAHYGGYTYRPHYDSVRNREKREEYAVYRFEHQFAGVLVLKNTERDGKTAQCILHRCLAGPEIQPFLDEGTFHDYAQREGIDNVEVQLEPGDLYFFNTGCVHEVPGVEGVEPRVVVATFIGYSSGDDEIFVWS